MTPLLRVSLGPLYPGAPPGPEATPLLFPGNHIGNILFDCPTAVTRVLEPLTQPCKARLLTPEEEMRLVQDLGLKLWVCKVHNIG